MVFLRSALDSDVRPHIQAGELTLRFPLASDYATWADLRGRSRKHLMPWEPLWAEDELSKGAYKIRLRHYERELRDQVGYAFFIFHGREEQLVGGLTLSNVRRGITQSCAMGYWIGAPFARRGFMTVAVKGATDFAFSGLRLHRVEAACLPSNAPSIRVLEKAGFQREGLARRYLKINGVWEDHLLFAALAEEWPGRN